MTPWVYYWLSTAVLAILLSFPASKMIWVLSVRRLERKSDRKLTDTERNGQLARARFIAIILTTAFALLFNYNLLGMSERG